jgi:hypothetical protein
VVVCGWLGTDCGGWFGDCSPSELGLAAGGNWGIAVTDDDRDEARAPVRAVAVRPVDFDASERPGATAETSAAKPAVSAAVPTITHRRVRPMREIAASRASAARDLSSRPAVRSLRLVIRRSSAIMTAKGSSAQ